MKTKLVKMSDVLTEQHPKRNRKAYHLVIGMPENEDSDFNPNGCDLVDTLACNTQEVECVIYSYNKTGKYIEHSRFTADVCDAVLDHAANGTEYFQNERGDWIAEYEINVKKGAL